MWTYSDPVSRTSAEESKVRSVMKSWIKCIYMAIARNVAFKAATMRDSIMMGQDEFIMRKTDSEGVGLEAGR